MLVEGIYRSFKLGGKTGEGSSYKTEGMPCLTMFIVSQEGLGNRALVSHW